MTEKNTGADETKIELLSAVPEGVLHEDDLKRIDNGLYEALHNGEIEKCYQILAPNHFQGCIVCVLVHKDLYYWIAQGAVLKGAFPAGGPFEREDFCNLSASSVLGLTRDTVMQIDAVRVETDGLIADTAETIGSFEQKKKDLGIKTGNLSTHG